MLQRRRSNTTMTTQLPNNKHSVSRILLSLGLITILTSGIVFSVATPRQTQAQQLRTFTISPPTIEHPVAPGGQAEGTIRIINDGNEALSFDATMQDFIVEDTQGQPSILQEDTLSNKYSAASWIAVYPRSFTVAPRDSYELRYYIQVPKEARPGGHYAAAIFKALSSLEVEGTGTAVQTQIGTLISVNVAGPITEKADITAFSTSEFQEYGPIDIKTQIKNMSDLHIKPKGLIKISNMLGKEAYTISFDEKNIFPEAARDYVDTFGKKLMIGRYKAELTASYGINNNLPLTATIYFWVFPWKIALVILLVLITVILGGTYMKKKKKNNTPINTQTDESEKRSSDTADAEKKTAPSQITR